VPMRSFPCRPNYSVLSEHDKKRFFGEIEYLPDPCVSNPERIKILNQWDTNNIVHVKIPQFKDVTRAPNTGKVAFHKRGADSFVKFWKYVEAENLLPCVKSWHGSYSPRLVRGSKAVLSTHAYGIAFDLNAKWNPFGGSIASYHEPGCLYDIVDIAIECGFFWGGHFNSVSDGMHFELADV